MTAVMGYDGSGDSAHDISDNNPIVMTAANQEGISFDIAEQRQGTLQKVILQRQQVALYRMLAKQLAAVLKD